MSKRAHDEEKKAVEIVQEKKQKKEDEIPCIGERIRILATKTLIFDTELPLELIYLACLFIDTRCEESKTSFGRCSSNQDVLCPCCGIAVCKFHSEFANTRSVKHGCPNCVFYCSYCDTGPNDSKYKELESHKYRDYLPEYISLQCNRCGTTVCSTQCAKVCKDCPYNHQGELDICNLSNFKKVGGNSKRVIFSDSVRKFVYVHDRTYCRMCYMITQCFFHTNSP